MSKAEEINRQDCLEHLEKIEAGKEFASARLDKKLLRYLVESTLEGRAIKETTIAIEVFAKNSNFNPGEDSSVRSHIYTIRKKLDSYYDNDGSNDPIRFVIPKGQYHVTFRKHSRTIPFLQNWPKTQVVLSVSLAVALFVCAVLILNTIKLQQAVERETSNPILKDFADSNLPTLFVIGDFYFYKTTNFAYSEISRIACINSDTDLDTFLLENPDASAFMEKDDNSYIGPNVIYELTMMLSELRNTSEIKINLASKVNYDDLRENNIIYLGSLKSLGILRNVMHDLKLQFDLCPHQIMLTSGDGDTVKVYQTSFEYPQDFKFTDYVVVAKFPGSNNNHILIISAFHAWDSGTTVKSLTDQQFFKDVSKQFSRSQPFPQYFEMLFQLNGFRRTSLNSQVVYLSKIEN